MRIFSTPIRKRHGSFEIVCFPLLLIASQKAVGVSESPSETIDGLLCLLPLPLLNLALPLRVQNIDALGFAAKSRP